MRPRTLITSALLTLIFSTSVLSAETNNTPTQAPRPEQLQQRQAALQALRAALVRIGNEKQQDEYATPIVEKSLELERTAIKLREQGDLREAQQQLTLALDVVKTAISTLRNHETLIRSLDFESPRDEFSYEKQRYESYCLLADLLLKNRSFPASILLRQEAQALADIATKQAAEQHFSEALKTQEQSNRLVIQAIRRSGVFIPG